MAPQRIVTGSRDLWFELPSMSLAMCGTASPINDIGPQNAVVVAVSTPVARRINPLVRLMLTPKFSAYTSPNSRALRGFISSIEMATPPATKSIKYGSFSTETLVKSPIPHITRAWTLSLDAWKLRIDMADEIIYPTIIPTMSNMVLLFILAESQIITPSTSAAPISAAMIIAIYPPNRLPPNIYGTPPNASITTATPKFAPLLTPNIDGSARGFRNRVCSRSPLTARAEPESRAVIAIGSLDSRIMCTHDGRMVSLGSPNRILIVSGRGISTAPRVILANQSSTIATVRLMYIVLCFMMFCCFGWLIWF